MEKKVEQDIRLEKNALPIGYTLGNGQYEIINVLGQGGFGITYAVLDKNLHRRVAVKEFYPQHCVFRDERTYAVVVPMSSRESYERSLLRFEQEGRILAQLNHKNIVKVFTLFRELGTVYLVMEFLEGHTLGMELEARNNAAISSRLVQKIIGVLVDALSTIHQSGIYHLDIKPDNIMLTEDGRIILLDFGAARWSNLGDPGHPKSIVAYTPEYAPLELLRGDEIGPETDIFEVGVLAYELLTGYRPPDVLERLKAEDWYPDNLEEPWGSMIYEAIKIERLERPHCIREWWYRGFNKQIVNVTRPARRNEFLENIYRLYFKFNRINSRNKYYVLLGSITIFVLFLCLIGWHIFSENNIGIVRFRAEEAVRKGDLPGALNYYNRALQIKSQDAFLYESRGDVRIQLKDFAGAILDYQDAIRLSGTSPIQLQTKLANAYINLGDYQQSLNNFSEAISSYQKAITIDVSKSSIAKQRIYQAQIGAANEKVITNQFLDAIEIYEQILSEKELSTVIKNEVRANLANVLFLYSEEMVSKDKLLEASKLLDLAIKQQNDKASLYAARGSLRLKLGEFAKALADLDKAIKLDDKAGSYYALRAVIKGKMNNYLSGIADYNQALRLDYDKIDVYLGRGILYMQINNYKSAIEDFNKVISKEENNVSAYLNRAWSLYYIKDYSQAILDFNEAIRLDADNPRAYEGSGYCKFYLRDRQGAKDDLDKAEELYYKNKKIENIEAIRAWRTQNSI